MHVKSSEGVQFQQWTRGPGHYKVRIRSALEGQYMVRGFEEKQGNLSKHSTSIKLQQANKFSKPVHEHQIRAWSGRTKGMSTWAGTFQARQSRRTSRSPLPTIQLTGFGNDDHVTQRHAPAAPLHCRTRGNVTETAASRSVTRRRPVGNSEVSPRHEAAPRPVTRRWFPGLSHGSVRVSAPAAALAIQQVQGMRQHATATVLL